MPSTKSLLRSIRADQKKILRRLARSESARIRDAAAQKAASRQLTKSMARQRRVLLRLVKKVGLKSRQPETAAARVAHVPELVEMILLCLGQIDVKDLLLAQRVSKHFKAVIDGSTKLQQALFFKADPDCTEPRLNPLITARLLNSMGLGRNSKTGLIGIIESPCDAAMERIEISAPTFEANPERIEGQVRFRTFFVKGKPEKTDWIRGSWQRMYATQPSTLQVLWSYVIPDDDETPPVWGADIWDTGCMAADGDETLVVDLFSAKAHQRTKVWSGRDDAEWA